MHSNDKTSRREKYIRPELVEHPQLTDVTTGASAPSDRNIKTNVAPVDGRGVLERLMRVPVSSWNYKKPRRSMRHIGPMAQDFNAAFEVGKDGKRIYTVDGQGVALAAIQELYRMLQDKDTQLAAQQEQIEALKARLDELEQ